MPARTTSDEAPFGNEEQVIGLVNESIYGLTSSVWGEEQHAIRVARRIEAGTTMINTAAVQGLDVRFPFGGVKQSGVGREYGAEGLLAYVETHVINAPKNWESRDQRDQRTERRTSCRS